MIVAGRHSIGTHAACMIATQPQPISDLEQVLKSNGLSLREKQKPIWAIVRGTLLPDGSMSSDVEIVKAGGFTPQTS